MKFIEWFFMLFFRKKANIIKQEVVFERHKVIQDYKKAELKNEKYISKYSGRKRYQKA